MATEEKKYLVNVESNLDKYAKDAAKAAEEVEKLAIENWKMQASDKATTAEKEKTSAALRNAQKEYRDAKKAVDLQTQANNSNINSRKQLNAIVTLEQKRLGALADTYAINEKGVRELSKSYTEQVIRLKEAKDAVIAYDRAQGDGRSSVGLYSEAIRESASMFRGLTGPIGEAVRSIRLVSHVYVRMKASAAVATTGVVSGMKAMKIAIASTGIGLLVIAASALIAIFSKLGIGKIMMDKLTDAIGLTTNAQDKLAEAQKISNEANIAGIENEIILLKAKGAAMGEIFQKEVDKAKATFETEKATLLAYARSKKNFDLAAKGGEQDLKLQSAKTAYFALLATQNKDRFDADTDYINQLTLLKKEGLDRDLEALDQWFAAESVKYPNDYALYLLYEEKKKQARLKAEAERLKKEEERLKKESKEIDDDFKRWSDYWDKIDKEEDKKAEDKWNKEVEHQRKVFDRNRKAGQKEWDARIKQEEALADAVLQIHESMNDSKMRIAAAATDFLSSISGENKALQNASLIADKAFAIAQVVIQTTKANATIRAMAAASVLPGPGYLARLGISMAAAMAPINLNRIAAAADIAAIIAAAAMQMKSNVPAAAPAAPTSISGSVSAQRTFASPVSSSFFTQPQLTQQQLNVAPQNLLTAADIANAISKLPNPIVTVEDINAKTESKRKIDVRAII